MLKLNHNGLMVRQIELKIYLSQWSKMCEIQMWKESIEYLGGKPQGYKKIISMMLDYHMNYFKIQQISFSMFNL